MKCYKNFKIIHGKYMKSIKIYKYTVLLIFNVLLCVDSIFTKKVCFLFKLGLFIEISYKLFKKNMLINSVASYLLLQKTLNSNQLIII